MLRLGNWTLLCLIIGMFGQVAYLGKLAKPFFNEWVFVSIFMVPVVAVLFVQPGECPERLVRGVHRFAAAWYVIIAIVVELLALAGYKPDGAAFFRVLIHLGWLHFWPLFVGKKTP